MKDGLARIPPGRRLILIVIGSVVALCVLCVCGSLGMQSLGLVPTSTPSLVPTNTLPPGPTDTPLPSETPFPTETPLPTPTSTPPPEPIVITGSGDSVVDIEKWDGPAIVKVIHNGGGNFALWSDDALGEHIDLLVNMVGSYQGTLPLDFLKNEYTHRFEIKAGGAWEIQVLPFESIRREMVPGTIQGVGDEVMRLEGSSSLDLLKADASGASGNFAIWTYSNSDRDLVINDIAPYTGTVPLDQSTFVVVISATGPWSIEITTR